MSEADFAGMDSGEYYAMTDFIARERAGGWNMKNRTVVRHGMLADLASYLAKSGWKLQETKGQYEVLRATSKVYPRPLLVYDRTSGGCGYSIDERDMKIYQGWKRNRRKRGLDADFPNYPRCADTICPTGSHLDCQHYEYGYCTKESEVGENEV